MCHSTAGAQRSVSWHIWDTDFSKFIRHILKHRNTTRNKGGQHSPVKGIATKAFKLC